MNTTRSTATHPINTLQEHRHTCYKLTLLYKQRVTAQYFIRIMRTSQNILSAINYKGKQELGRNPITLYVKVM